MQVPRLVVNDADMKKLLLFLLLFLVCIQTGFSQTSDNKFQVRGFHLDLRIQVMPMPALKTFAKRLSESGINTLIMEWEGTYPFEKHPLIPNRYAYTKAEIVGFVKYCNTLGIDVIPLQQSFGHVEYILRNEKYKELREDQKDYSQVCPLQTKQDSALFTDLYTELASTHTSKYIHIGGDETYLLGHDERCKLMVAKEGKSKLYIDYIRMLCNIVIKLGKRPVLWADIAMKYPEAINLLPKGTVLVDWNYGWSMNNFGDHQKLMESGYEIWGAPALRSHPDNYFLTQWEKHFNNIRNFVPVARDLGYKGIVMTSWSTSGAYSSVFETDENITDLYAIRHVYPISGFNILLAAYIESIKSPKPLDIEMFVTDYCKKQYGFNQQQSAVFWKALKAAPYQVMQGEVVAPKPISINQLLDSTNRVAKTLNSLQPTRNLQEFEHYRLMTDIRIHYLKYEAIEKMINANAFNLNKILTQLKSLMATSNELDKRFIVLNKDYLYPAELAQENELRNVKIRLLYQRLSRKK
ncbi:MAG: beta-N-acetylhexosaminidase [Mucilaginibacter sp.]|nr:beta-N-acetylhexosaminidase [Mucilaginibacter sp.]